jgi:transcription-repair coupling factor (superfamily II helicase)
VNLTNAIKHLAALLERQADDSRLPPLPSSAEAFTLAALAAPRDRTLLWITPDPDTTEQACRNLHALVPALEPFILPYPPASGLAPSADNGGDDPDIAGQRLHTLYRLAELPASTPAIVITCTAALLQPTASPGNLHSRTQFVAVDETLDSAALLQRLAQTGYGFESEVVDKGQASRRGGIIDIWPPDSDWPLRIELFGDSVESLRLFDPLTQRAVEKIASFRITPAQETTSGETPASTALTDHIRGPLTVVWHDAAAIEMQAQHLQIDSPGAGLLTTATLREQMRRRADTRHLDIGADNAGIDVTFDPLPCAVALPATAGAAQLDAARQRLLDDLDTRARRHHHIAIFFDTQGSLDHFRLNLARAHSISAMDLRIGQLSEGFCAESLRLTVVAESDLYGRRRTLRRHEPVDGKRGRAGRYAGSRITDFTDMEEDDLVVHVDHGVGRYLGVREITFNNQLQEVLAIEYAEGAMLYVPVTHAHLLSRYVGMAGRSTNLHRLGGSRWAREKGAAQKAVHDLAAELLEIQARRNLLQGHAFAPDTPMQHEFENAFPFQETVDQETVIRDVRADMESIRPMDRLICGDAGYGKTEVAMRAAFKAVQDNHQVAVLVPTTVLAQQHYQTFSERMAGFNVRIAMISRFQTPARRREILQSLATGEVDIIIGTHALVQPGVSFACLGLVVIDEEQRFGVAHKERLKKVRQQVDVLTLSATPIPRTLYMSMTGARDMSLIRTPPRERVAIETIMANATDDVIRSAIRRELARRGQVYFLHNRVMSIQRLRARIAALVPEAAIEIAHGQMKASTLSGVMRRFAAGEVDVLLCTTIIESGLDIPHANTILIDRADRFGIADLYQLRGRVGRSDRKAYAYLLLPAHGIVDSDARERIQAVRRHAGLGAGFNLAVRDMEIRGAGNILGSAQSGHISAVGFGLYCRLLERAIARLKGEAVAPLFSTELRLDFIRPAKDGEGGATAMLPHAFIPDERLRVAVYRRLAEATELDAVADLQAEVADRFGPLPSPVKRLFAIAELRVLAAARGISVLEVRESRIMIRHGKEYHTDSGTFPRLHATSPDRAIAELRRYLERTEVFRTGGSLDLGS